MKHFHKQLVVYLKMILLGLVFVGYVPAIAQAQARLQLITSDQAKVGELSMSLALGYGEKSNPLYKSDAFPLIIIPSVHYYSKNWYFDNGDLAYTLAETAQYSVNLLTNFNSEAAHFHDWHPSNILVSSQFVQMDTSVVGPQYDGPQTPTDSNSTEEPIEDIGVPAEREPEVVEKLIYHQVAKRKWNIDAGVQLHWFIDDQQVLKVRWMHDAMGIHQGQNVKFEYSYKWRMNAWQHKVRGGFDWLSSDLANYYYGISARDTATTSLWYNTGSAILPYIGYSSLYRLNAHWAWVMSVHYQKLNSGIKLSPIVDKGFRYSVFTGMKYVF